MEAIDKNHEWDTIESELRSEFDRLEKANNKLGNKYDRQVEDLRYRVDQAIRTKDVANGRQVLKDINDVFMACTFIYQLMGMIQEFSRDFNSISWKDANAARQHVNRGMQMIGSGNPDVEELRQVCVRLIDLLDMPENEKPKM